MSQYTVGQVFNENAMRPLRVAKCILFSLKWRLEDHFHPKCEPDEFQCILVFKQNFLAVTFVRCDYIFL